MSTEDGLLEHCLAVIDMVTTVWIDDYNIWNEVQAHKEYVNLPLDSKVCIPFVHLNTPMIISHANKPLPTSL